MRCSSRLARRPVQHALLITVGHGAGCRVRARRWRTRRAATLFACRGCRRRRVSHASNLSFTEPQRKRSAYSLSSVAVGSLALVVAASSSSSSIFMGCYMVCILRCPIPGAHET